MVNGYDIILPHNDPRPEVKVLFYDVMEFTIGLGSSAISVDVERERLGYPME